MTGFQFETGPQEGTNRAAAITECATCGGDRFVPVEVTVDGIPAVWDGSDGGYTEAYMRCPTCNAPPREPITEERRWEP